eukprot:g29526.t1
MVERYNVDGNVIVRTICGKASEGIVPEADLKLVHPSFKVGDKVKPPTQEGFSPMCSIEFELSEEKLKDTGLASKLVNLPAWLLLPSDTQSEESQSATEDSKDNRKKRSTTVGWQLNFKSLVRMMGCPWKPDHACTVALSSALN